MLLTRKAHHPSSRFRGRADKRNFFGDYANCVTTIEVVGFDYSKGFGNGFFAHEHGMVCSPWLGAVGRAGVAFGKLVESLENELGGLYAFIFVEYFFAEILLKISADNE